MVRCARSSRGRRATLVMGMVLLVGMPILVGSLSDHVSPLAPVTHPEVGPTIPHGSAPSPTMDPGGGTISSIPPLRAHTSGLALAGGTRLRSLASCQPAPCVANTLDLWNNSLQVGNFLPSNTQLIVSMAYDPPKNRLYIIGSGGSVAIFSASTRGLLDQFQLSSNVEGEEGAAYDPLSGSILFGESTYYNRAYHYGFDILNDTTNTIVGNVSAFGAEGSTTGLLYDPYVKYMMASTNAGNFEINATTYASYGFGNTELLAGVALDTLKHWVLFPAYGNLYAYNDTNGVQEWDASSCQSATGLTYVVPKNEVWVSCSGNDYVMTFNATTGSLTGEISGLVTPPSILAVPGTTDVLVTNGEVSGSGQLGNISVFSSTNDSLVGQLPGTGADPAPMVYLPSEGEVAVGFTGAATLNTLAPLRQVGNLTVGTSPWSAAFDAATNELFIPNYNEDNVSVVSTLTDQVVAWVPVGALPTAAVCDPASGEIFVTNTGSDTVSVISDTNLSLVATLPTSTGPESLAFDPQNGYVYVGAAGSDMMMVVNGTSNQVVKTFALGFPVGSIAVDTQQNLILVGPRFALYLEVYFPNLAPVEAVPLSAAPSTLAYDPESSSTYVGLGSGVDVFSDSNWSQTRSLTASGTVQGLQYDPEDQAIIAETSATLNGINFYSAVTGASLANVTAGDSPWGGAVVPPLGVVAIVNYLGGSISLVSTGFGVTQFVATPNPLSLGESTNLSVATINGVGPLTFAYTGLPPGCSSANSSTLSCHPTSEGTYDVNVTVTDAAHHVVTASLTLVVTPLRIVTFTASTNPVLPEHSTNLTLTISGGLPPYTYAYQGLPAGCTSANTSTLACTPRQEGTFGITGFVTDATQHQVRANLTLVVTSMALSTFTALPSTIDLGQSTSLNVSVLGGVAPYTYTYSGLPRGCSSANISSLTCRPTGEGVFDPQVNVTDALGWTDSATLELTINQSLASLILSPTPSASLLPDGHQDFFAAALNSTGAGLPTPSYTWAITPAFLGNLNMTTGSTVELVAGSTLGQGRLYVNATFATYFKSASDAVYVSETAGPSILSFAASPSSIALGSSTVISTQATGTGTLKYVYTGLPPGCSSQDASDFTCTPTATGTFPLGVSVTDPIGREVNGSASLTVTPPSAGDVLASLDVTPPGPLDLQLGASEGFSASPLNATGKLLTVSVVIDWALTPAYLGTLNTTTGRSVILTTGQHSVQGTLYVNATWDGVTKSEAVAITVAPAGEAPSGPTYFGLSEFDFVSLIVAIMAVVVGIIPVILELRKRENRKEARKAEEKKEDEKEAAGMKPGDGPKPGGSEPPATSTISTPLPPGPEAPSAPAVSSGPSAATSVPEADLSFVLAGPTAASAAVAPVPETSTEPEPSPSVSTPPAPTKACIICGKDIPGRARFCPFCKEAQA